jgi:hypothetical protein
VPPRLSPAERVRAEIDELFASEQDLGEVLEEVARLSVRLVIQAAVEAEVTEFLGRDRYARGERERAGHRNGHAELTVKTTAGPVVLERPKLRGTTEPFTSRLLGKGVSRTNALEALVLSGFVRGLSVRDVEAALAEALGPEAALSKSTVSRVCEAIKTEFDAWQLRDLGGIELEYLFLDGSHYRMHPGARAEPVLCAWGLTTQGTPLLVGLAPGAHEGHDPWASFLGELVERGLRAPLLVITDGAPGLIGAVELVLANSLRQRCLIHRACAGSSWWLAGGRCGVVGGDEGEQLRLGAKPHGRGWELEAVFLQQGKHVVDRVADGATAHVKQVGECPLGADLPQVQDSGQDPFRVGDLLLEDAPSGARQPVAASALVAAPLDQGGLPDRQALHQQIQVGARHAGQGWIGQLLMTA